MPDSQSNSERNPEVERSLDDLAAEVSRRPGGPGAEAAIGTVRKRRRGLALAGLAAAALVAAGAVVLPQVLDDDPSVVADGPEKPAASALSVGDWDDATEGWLGPWEEAGEERGRDLGGGLAGCLAQMKPDEDVHPAERDGNRLLAAGDSLALVRFADFGEEAERAEQAYEQFAANLDRCADEPVVVDRADGEFAQAWVPGESGYAPQSLWVVRRGNTLAVVTVAPAREAPTEAVATGVGDLTLASLGAEESFTTSTLKGLAYR